MHFHSSLQSGTWEQFKREKKKKSEEWFTRRFFFVGISNISTNFSS